MDCPIRVLDPGLNLVAEFDAYKSARFSRTWADCKEFEIVLDARLDPAEAFQKDSFVVFGYDGRKNGVIEDVTREEAADGVTLTVTGYEAKYIFARRLVLPPAGSAFYTHGTSGAPVAVETVLKTLVSSQCGPLATDALRRFSRLSIAASVGRGGLTFISSRYRNLLTELKELSLGATIGFSLAIDMENHLFVFDCYEGVDHSSGNPGNNPVVIFSTDFDSAGRITVKDTNSGYANTVVVGGQGTGAARTVSTRPAVPPSDLARREVFLNAGTLAAADLAGAGDAELNRLGFTNFIDAEALVYNAFVLDQDYTVGDVVSVAGFDRSYSVRITGVEEVHDQDGYSISMTFDKSSPELPEYLIGKIQALQGDMANAQ